MLLTLTRNRHNAVGASPTGSTCSSSSHLPVSSKHNGGGTIISSSSISNDKYSKNSHTGNGNNNGRMTLAARLQFWSWIVCGVICSFLSIDYSMRTFFPSDRMTSDGGGVDSSSSSSSNMESILTPLRSVGASLVAKKTNPPATPAKHRSLLPTDDEYSFDNTAHIVPDPLQHAILIPYRDRKFHLELFLEYMGPYLEHHFPHAQFTLWIIEQDDTELFNRAWLANVGLREIVQQQPQTSCVIFHDVDLVPNMTSHVPYTTCQYPIQLGSELQHFNWTVPYPAYCGGITSLSLKHWQLINGLGNDYIGWGGEDDDLYHRLRQNGLLYQPDAKDSAPVPRRPPKGQGVFRTISQKAEHHEQKKTHNQYWKTLELLKEMHENSERWKFDGMNDAYYTITNSKTTMPKLGFSRFNHIKVIPQKTPDGKVIYHKNADGSVDGKATPLAPLEFVHVPYTGGQAITAAAAKAGIVWGACHYGQFEEWNCPAGGSGDFIHAPINFKASYDQSLTPWHIPLMRFLENPMEGTKRFTVVRHPYSRAISFYRYTFDKQHGYPHGFKYHNMVENINHPPLAVAEYIREREHPAKLNSFLQDFLIRSHHPHRPDGIDLIPQVTFVYHRGIKYVHHVLHYEFLQRDFKNILEKFEMKDVIELPPPDRKRKRKKQHVKTYEEKRVPRSTRTWKWFLLSPLYRFLGVADPEPPVVDMSLAEIEDEYLLGAQDLANETIAMLNSHFELDFRKFHYAKIKVNATTDAYWNPIQVIPRESAVSKQQSERNNALSKAKGTGGQAAATTTAKQQQQATAKKPHAAPNGVVYSRATKQKEHATANAHNKQDNERAAVTGVRRKSNDDLQFKERAARLKERLKAKKDGGDGYNKDAQQGSPAKKSTEAMTSMREMAERLRKKNQINDAWKEAR